MGVFIEGLNYYRYKLTQEIQVKINEKLGSDKANEVLTDSFKYRALIFFVYFATLFSSYILMLIVMTFNALLFVAAVLGLALGYFIFGFIKRKGYTRIYFPETDKCCTSVE